MAFVTDIREFQALLEACSSTREREIFYLALKTGYINKTPKLLNSLYFNFVWLLQNRFLLSISRKLKLIIIIIMSQYETLECCPHYK